MLQLTEEESALIVDALNGTVIQPELLAESVLWQEIQDAIKLDSLDAKWKVDGSALVAKLKAASHEDAQRIIGLAELFWGEKYQVQDTYARLREIGMANIAPADDEFITATEAAKLSGKSVQHLSQLAARGKLKIYPDLSEPNPRKRNRYLRSQVQALKAPKPKRRKAALSRQPKRST